VRGLFERLDGGSEELNDVEIEYQRDGGEPRILSLNARRLQASGQERLILMAFEDITERKRAAEARYRRVFDSARDGIVLVSAASGEITDVNPFTEQLLGYPRDELVGRNLWEIEPLRNLPGMRAAFEQIRDRGVLRFDEIPLRTKEGRDLHAEVIASVYSEGDRPAIQLNMRDVSERRKFERELRETQKLESLGLLAGGIAHDFNNLLTGIIGNASLAYSELPGDHPLRMYLREIVQAGERAAFLTRQMLAYAGKGRFVIERIEVGDLIREISTLIRTSIPKSVELKLDLAPDLPPIEADPAQIQQVLMNLVINGAEAVGEHAVGKVEVWTSLRELNAREAAEFFGPEPSAPEATCKSRSPIPDRGWMRPPRRASSILSSRRSSRAVGWGLRPCRESSKGTAGRFASIAPRAWHVLSDSAARPAPESRGRRTEKTARGTHSAGIDRARHRRRGKHPRACGQRALARGVKALSAVDGKAGVEMFREHHAIISAVILDLLMPAMDGEEVFALLKGIDPDVPVIMSSGFDETEVARRFPETKPARFLQKPYTARVLIEAVAAALKRGMSRGGKAE